MHYELLESDAQLAALVDEHRGSDFVIVDTEFMRRDTFYPQAALIQLCFPSEPETAWLLDPLVIDDCSPLQDLFRDPSMVKALHSASEDLEVFQQFLGCQPLPLFDTQRAAAFVGRGFGLGYRALVEAMSGLELAKGETLSNWLARPLSWRERKIPPPQNGPCAVHPRDQENQRSPGAFPAQPGAHGHRRG